MTGIALVIGYTLLFSIVILKWRWFRDPGIYHYLFVFLFLVKIGAGIFAGELYLKRYQGGDSFTFFQDSKIITSSFYKDPADFILFTFGAANEKDFFEKYGNINSWDNLDVVYNDNKTILRINGVIGLFSMGNYNVHVVFFAFISMLGLTGIFKGIRLLTKNNPYMILAGVFLIPGVVFWLSLASKESILIFAMGLMFYHCMRLLTVSKSFGNIAGMFCAAFLFIHIKAYLLILITPCLLAFTWVTVTNNRWALLKYMAIYVALGIVLLSARYWANGFDPLDIVYMKRMNFEAFAYSVPKDMGSYIRLPEFSPSLQSLFTILPFAILTVFTRPYLWESESLLITFAAIENILIILILAIGFIYFNKQVFRKNLNLILFCIFFVLSVYMLIGITTPVMGAIVRYKVPVLPFLCILPALMVGGAPAKQNPDDINSVPEEEIPEV